MRTKELQEKIANAGRYCSRTQLAADRAELRGLVREQRQASGQVPPEIDRDAARKAGHALASQLMGSSRGNRFKPSVQSEGDKT